MIAAYIISYNDENIILDAINSLKPCVDKIVVAVGLAPFHGQVYSQDNTIKICRDAGCEVVTGVWKTEASQRNSAMALAEVGADLVIPMEPDMVWDKNMLDRLIIYAMLSDAKAIKAKQRAYWFDRSHIILNDPYNPIVAVKPGVRVTNCANVDTQNVEFLENVFVHHYNWCAPKDILKKVKTYHHAPQIPKDWYENNYLTWKEGEPARFPDCTLEVMKV